MAWWRSLVWLLLVALLLQACRPEARGTLPSYRNIDSTTLYTMLGQKDFLLVNVHIPYEGRIPGTDVFIPYNEIDNNREKLPSDKGAKIVVYCMSGNMSATAASRLMELGYTQIINLKQGMLEWHQQGYPLEDWAR